MARKAKIGVVDTLFARADMGGFVVDELQKKFRGRTEIVRRTVPGFKDLAVEALLLLEKEKCEIAVACGMVGRAPIDEVCANQASLAIGNAQLLARRHILEVFVHETERPTERELLEVCEDRCRKHAVNAANMVLHPEKLVRLAGTGARQGFADAGKWRKDR
jgi:riboflavin synthase